MIKQQEYKPFVDIFKQYDFFDKFEKKGNVKAIFNKDIGRMTFDIKGKISAANFLDIQNIKKDQNSQNFCGKYLYLCFKCSNQKQFYIHLDYYLQNKSKVYIHISNQYKNFESKQQDIFIPYKNHQNKWSLVIIDIHSLIKYFKLCKDRADTVEFFKARFCSSMKVKGIYVSDNLYNQNNIPQEISFIINNEKQWNKTYNFFKVENNCINIVEIKKDLNKENLQEKANNQLLQQLKEIKQVEQKEKKNENQDTKKQIEKQNITQDFQIQLKKIVGFTGKTCPDIKFVKYFDKEYIAYASGKVIVLQDVNELQNQIFLEGHKELITCIEYHQQSQTIISCSGQQKCTTFLHNIAHEKIKSTKLKQDIKEIRLVTVCPKQQYIAFVGQSNLSKDCILIYQMYPTPKLMNKHISEFNILCLKFSPVENLRLISCGKENIKFWRIKNYHMNGCPVVLNNYARQSIFTVLDFDMHKEQNNIVNNNKIIVGSNQGMIFIVNYISRNLESVYKVHDSAIYALSVYGGFCVTGSEDNFLRVWPLDFNAFHLETKFEDSVIATDIYYDGLKVAIGVSSGFIGILNLAEKNCKTILRAHGNEILQIKKSPNEQKMLTLGDDYSIRIWDHNLQQENYEFNYTDQDKCNTVIFIDENYFFGGFDSGTIRYFDINNLKVVQELVYHRSKIICFSKDNVNSILVTGDASGVYSIIDLKKDFNLITYLKTENYKFPKVSCSISNTLKQIALIGENNAQINFYDMKTFELKHVQKLTKSFVHTLKFNSLNDKQLMLLTSNCSVEIVSINNDQYKFKQSITNAHIVCLYDAVCIAKDMYATCGGDGILKIWQFVNKKAILVNQKHYSLNNIYSLEYSFKNKTIYSVGGCEGVFIWEIQNDLQNYSLQQSDSNINEQQSQNEDLFKKEFKNEGKNQIINLNTQKDEKLKIDDSLIDYENFHLNEQQIKEKQKQEEQLQEIERQNDEQEQLYLTFGESLNIKQIKIEKYEEKSDKKQLLKKQNTYRKNLPLCHYYKQTHKKYIKLSKEKKLALKKITGIELSSLYNYVWNNLKNEIYYFLENKLVIQKIQTQIQQILHFEQPINNVFLNEDKNFIYITAHNLQQNKDSYIYKVDLEDLTVKEYNFNFKSIQKISISQDDRYIGVIGTYQDSKIQIFDQTKKEIIYKFKNQETLNDCQFFYDTDNQQYLFFVVDEKNFQVVQFRNSKTPKKIQINVIQKKQDIKLTSIQIIQTESKETLILLGDNIGNLILFVQPNKNIFEQKNFRFVQQQNITDSEIIFMKKSLQNDRLILSTSKNELIQVSIDIKQQYEDQIFNLNSILQFTSPVLNISIDKSFEKGLCLLQNSEVNYFDIQIQMTQKYTQMTNSHNQVHQLIPLQNNNYNWLIIIFDNGQTDIYDLEYLIQQKNLIESSTISHGIFVKQQNKLFLFSQEQEILIFDVSEQDILLQNCYQILQQDMQQQGFFKNIFIDSCLLGNTQQIMVSNKLGDCFVLDYCNQNIEIKNVYFMQNNMNVSSLEYGHKQYLAVSDKSKTVKIFQHQQYESSMSQQQFVLISEYKVQNIIKDDYAWTQVKFLSAKNLVAILNNNCKELVIYDYINDCVQTKISFLSQPRKLALKNNILFLACECILKRIKICFGEYRQKF